MDRATCLGWSIRVSFLGRSGDWSEGGDPEGTPTPPKKNVNPSGPLRRYGVWSKSIWIGNEAAKGYMMNDFKEAFKRYIPPSEWEALKAEWRVEEDGRKAAGAGGKPEERGQSGEESDQNPEAGTHMPDPRIWLRDNAPAGHLRSKPRPFNSAWAHRSRRPSSRCS